MQKHENDNIITISSEDPGSSDARLLMDELSGCLKAITGSSGRSSFDPADVCAERAVFAVARDAQGRCLGCGAFRPVDDSTAEVKRVYAKEKGGGTGTAILNFLESEASKLGYTALILETRAINRGAVSFYESRGYRRIANFGRYAGRPEAVCFEKRILPI